MHLLWTILVGLVVGAIAKALHPGKENMGCLATTLLGIGGSLLATYGGQMLGLYKAGQSAGFIGALIGAILLLVIYGAIAGRGKGPASD